ncbi:NAD(+) salvage pathway protein [Saitoella coloradoensis]
MTNPNPPPTPFTPALLLIDLQNDFFSGSLAVPSALSTLPTTLALLRLPAQSWTLIVGTVDWHPSSHISFADSWEGKSVGDTVRVERARGGVKLEQKLWPVHCVRGSWGAESILDERDRGLVRAWVRKGEDEGLESYSAFGDIFGETKTGMEELFEKNGITHIYVVGVATDFCVLHTARDAARVVNAEGERRYEVFVVEEGVAGVGRDTAEAARRDMEEVGVRFVRLDGEEVGWVKGRGES